MKQAGPVFFFLHRNTVFHIISYRTCVMKIWISFGSDSWYILSQQVKCENAASKKKAPLCTSCSFCAIWAPRVGSLKKIQIIMVDLGTWYYPPLRLRCLYISNLGDQAAGLQSWSTQWLAINGLGSTGRAHPWQRFPCGYGLWHRGTCPKPSALIWQIILYQRPLHWFWW